MDSTTLLFFFFFNDTATTEIYTLSLHDALPISICEAIGTGERPSDPRAASSTSGSRRSEEHTSELQSRPHLVCRLLLEKKKKTEPVRAGSRVRAHRGTRAAAHGSAVLRCRTGYC